MSQAATPGPGDDDALRSGSEGGQQEIESGGVPQEINQPPLGRSAASGASWTASARLLSQVATTLTFVVLTRLLAPEAFGLVAMAGVFVGAATAFVDFGLGNWLIQRRPLKPIDVDTVFWSNLFISLVVAASITMLAPTFAQLAGQPELTPILRVLTLAFPIAGLSLTQSALLRRGLRYRPLAVGSVAGTLLGAFAGVAAALAGWGVWSLVAQSLVAAAASSALFWRFSAWRPSLRMSATSLRQSMRFGIWVVGVGLLGAAWDQLDAFLVGSTLSPADAGQYAVGKKIVMFAIGMASGAVVAVSLPVFSRVVHDSARMQSAYLRSATASLASSATLLVPIVVAGPHLVPALFGQAWYPAGQVCALLAIQQLVGSVSWIDRTALYSVGRSGREFWITLGAVSVMPVAVIFGGAKGGVAGAAAGLVVLQIGIWPIRLASIRASVGIAVRPIAMRSARIWLAILCGIAAGVLVSRNVHASPLWLSLMSGMVALLTYAGALRLSCPEVLWEILVLAPTKVQRVGSALLRR